MAKTLEQITGGVSKVSDLVAEIATASQEQSQGIGQVNTAVQQMDKVTQSNAANAEESASASEELSSQAEQLNAVVGELIALVGGKRPEHDGGGAVRRTGGAKPQASRAAAEKALGAKGSQDFGDFGAAA